MKKNGLLIFIILSFCIKGQITPLNSGTSVNLYQIFATDQNILIGGITNNYLVKSYDECKNLIPLTHPAPSNYYNYFQRLDTSNIFLISRGNTATLYRSYNGGLTWTPRWTTGYPPRAVVFFDSLEGITDKGYGNTLLRTLDGGASWSPTVTTLVLGTNAISYMEGYSDSTIIVCDYGAFYISNDRGHTWPIAWGATSPFSDFCFLNKDTIFGVTSVNNFGEAYITKTTNGGNNWKNSFAPIPDCRAIKFRTETEGYVLGTDFLNKAVIAKTTDMGQTWSRFNLGFPGELNDMVFLNDSIAIIVGTQGLLLRWNFKSALYTRLSEHFVGKKEVSTFPNPVRDLLSIKTDLTEELALSFTDIYGRETTKMRMPESKEIPINDLADGIYLLNLYRQNSLISTKKIVVIKN